LGNEIGDSNELSATPTAGATPTATPPASGGGGGGGYGGTITLKGYGYISGTVYVLRDAQLLGSVNTDTSGHFSFPSSFTGGGTYKYSLYGVDKDGLRSALTSLLVTVAATESKTVNNIVLPPTLSLVNDQLNKGDTLVARGYTFPLSNVYGKFSIPGVTVSVKANGLGYYEFSIATSNFPTGVHSVQTQATVLDGFQSVFSNPVGFGLDTPYKKRYFNIPRCGLLEQPDLNCDGRVNIIDVSILMFYFKRPLVPGREFVDLNGDGKVDIIEFSIIAYFWTG